MSSRAFFAVIGFLAAASWLATVRAEQSSADRSEWELKVAAATARAQLFQQEALSRYRGARLNVIPQGYSEDEAIEAAMSDSTLRYGDLVATKSGFLVYSGRRGFTPPKESDFVPADDPR